jgi:hypothetical protein
VNSHAAIPPRSLRPGNAGRCGRHDDCAIAVSAVVSVAIKPPSHEHSNVMSRGAPFKAARSIVVDLSQDDTAIPGAKNKQEITVVWKETQS